MPRYFLHIVNSVGRVRDEDGSEHPDARSAREEAILSIRAILSEEVRMEGKLDLGGHIEITDEHGTVLEIVTFSSAVLVTNGE